jgi:hypothetical protein
VQPTVDACGPPAVQEIPQPPQFWGSDSELLSQYGWLMSQCCHGLGQLAATGMQTLPVPQLN